MRYYSYYQLWVRRPGVDQQNCRLTVTSPETQTSGLGKKSGEMIVLSVSFGFQWGDRASTPGGGGGASTYSGVPTIDYHVVLFPEGDPGALQAPTTVDNRCIYMMMFTTELRERRQRKCGCGSPVDTGQV